MSVAADEFACPTCGMASTTPDRCSHCGAPIHDIEHYGPPMSLRVGTKIIPISDPSCLNALFATTVVRLENGFRGSRFPFCQYLWEGLLLPQHCEQALIELREIRRELSQQPIAHLVWNMGDSNVAHAWTTQSGTATSLAEFFRLSDGTNLLDLCEEVLKDAVRQSRAVTLTAKDW